MLSGLACGLVSLLCGFAFLGYEAIKPIKLALRKRTSPLSNSRRTSLPSSNAMKCTY